MIHKTRKFEGLNELPVYIEDETALSPDYFDVVHLPKVLHAGKNLVRLKGNDENLKIGSAIYIELLDFNNDPIYYEVADFLYEDNSRIISIWIYEDTPPGEAKLYIMGEVDQVDGVPVPDEYRNTPNIRWTGYFTVDNSKRNDSEIVFSDDNRPTLMVEEKIRPYLVRSYPDGQFVTQSIGKIDYTLSGENPQITLKNNLFLPEHIGASIKITPNNAQPTLNINVDDSTYWAKIKSVLTTSSAVLDTKYYLEANNSGLTYTAKELRDCNYEIHYEASPVYNVTQNLRSTAYLRINNIDPAVGEVYRAKTFVKSRGSSAAWELVDDTVLKESDMQDILIDTGSIDIKTRMGEFTSNEIINTYWTSELKQRQNGTTIIDPPTYISSQQLTYDTGSYLLQSMHISSDTNTIYPQTYIDVRHNYSKEYEQDGQYDLTFNAVTRTSQTLGTGKKPYIEFYISGSAFASKTDTFGLGKKIGELDVASLQPNAKGDSFRFENKTFTFGANDYGMGTLVIKVNAGEWWISDLSIKSSYELGFNPWQNAVVIALPTEHVNDELDFKVEYYDYQGQQSKYISYCDACEFEGGNVYIGGEKNLLTGSLFVGNGTGSGVEINGIVGGFVRSIGYSGFNAATNGTGSGFALWSGSGFYNQVNQFTDWPEDYNGVGLELHAGGNSGSLLFRTHPKPRFEVKTPAFFFGDEDNYISGSNGNLVISGSNIGLSTSTFFLGSAGAYISGSNGNIEIAGANLNIDVDKLEVGAAGTGTYFLAQKAPYPDSVIIESTDFVLGNKSTPTVQPTDSFIQGSTAGIEIDSPNFTLSTAGAIVATSGDIAGFDFDAGKLTAGSNPNIVGIQKSTTSNTLAFFAGATSTSPTTATADFWVKADGSMKATGVQVITIGGDIMLDTEAGIVDGKSIFRELFHSELHPKWRNNADVSWNTLPADGPYYHWYKTAQIQSGDYVNVGGSGTYGTIYAYGNPKSYGTGIMTPLKTVTVVGADTETVLTIRYKLWWKYLHNAIGTGTLDGFTGGVYVNVWARRVFDGISPAGSNLTESAYGDWFRIVSADNNRSNSADGVTETSDQFNSVVLTSETKLAAVNGADDTLTEQQRFETWVTKRNDNNNYKFIRYQISVNVVPYFIYTTVATSPAYANTLPAYASNPNFYVSMRDVIVTTGRDIQKPTASGPGL